MSQEPLDYQTPRSRDNTVMTCSHCGGSRVVEGMLFGGTRVRFLPKRITRFWTFSSGAKTVTYACVSCGSITMVIDPDELRRLMRPGDSGGSAAT